MYRHTESAYPTIVYSCLLVEVTLSLAFLAGVPSPCAHFLQAPASCARCPCTIARLILTIARLILTVACTVLVRKRGAVFLSALAAAPGLNGRLQHAPACCRRRRRRGERRRRRGHRRRAHASGAERQGRGAHLHVRKAAFQRQGVCLLVQYAETRCSAARQLHRQRVRLGRSAGARSGLRTLPQWPQLVRSVYRSVSQPALEANVPYSVLGSGCSPVDGAHDAKPFPQKQVLLVWQMPWRLQGSARGKAQQVRCTPFRECPARDGPCIIEQAPSLGVPGMSERAPQRWPGSALGADPGS